LKQTGGRIDLVRSASQAATHDLLTEQLAREGPKPHDVGDGPRVPALGEHSHRDHALDRLTRLPWLTHGVDCATQQLGSLIDGESPCWRPVRIDFLFVAHVVGPGFLLGFGSFQNPRVDVQRPLGYRELWYGDVAAIA